jgi:hypothetical protein
MLTGRMHLMQMLRASHPAEPALVACAPVFGRALAQTLTPTITQPIARGFTLAVVLAFVLAAAGFAMPALAATTRVDDSGTVVSQGVVPMRWKQLVPGRGADHAVEASVRVAARLNLAPWLNRTVRMYMALAPSTGEPVYASWRTQGRLLPGSLKSGARVLVFEGVVKAALMEETMDLALSTDGRSLQSPQTLQFYFEVDAP